MRLEGWFVSGHKSREQTSQPEKVKSKRESIDNRCEEDNIRK